MNSKSPIGIFDSGLGGLTVVAAIRNLLPDENIIYFGDTARVPYGNKSKETVIRYSTEILDFLLKQEVKFVVAACNTASSYAISSLRKKTNVPILGVVEPGINSLIKLCGKNKKAAVIATKATIKSKAYEKILARKDHTISLYSKSCPLFVPLIEEGLLNNKITRDIVKEYLNEIQEKKIQHIILGCTHYPLLKEIIQEIYPHFSLIDSSLEIASVLKNALQRKKILRQQNSHSSLSLYVSDITDSLKYLKKLFLGGTSTQIKRVIL